jgi:hypothetical protein
MLIIGCDFHTRYQQIAESFEHLLQRSRRSRFPSSLWQNVSSQYSRTIRFETELRYPYNCIKSGGDFSRPATEPQKRPRC